MSAEEARKYIATAIGWIREHNIWTIKIAFLVAMMLIGHHRGLFPFHPIKIPIAHGLNQILGALVWTAIGVAILALTNKLLGW